MNLKLLSQIFSPRDLRNAAVGAIVVIGGLGLSGLTLYAHQIDNNRLAVTAATMSLVFVLLILVFVVPPLARNASREASQMNLPFEFTTGGAIMLVLILIVGFSAWNTGNNLLFIVLSFLLAVMVVGFFAGSICLRKLDVKMRFPETIFAGEPTPILVSLNNRKRLFPTFSVVAEVRGKERERSIADDELKAILPSWIAERLGKATIVRRTLNHFGFVDRNQTHEARTDHIFPHRGRLIIKDFELSTKFPFGFFRHRRRLPARETELIVFPTPQPYSQADDDAPLNTGQIVADKRGMGQDLLALRDYQPNDDFRHIDWKATARTRHLTVREYAAEDEKRITLVFDTQIPEKAEKRPSLREKIAAEQSGKGIVISERFETGIRLTSYILARFANENAIFRLFIDGEAGEYDAGRQHLHDCLRRIAVTEPNISDSSSSAEPEQWYERIFSEPDDSHWYLITANGLRSQQSDDVRTLKIIDF